MLIIQTNGYVLYRKVITVLANRGWLLRILSQLATVSYQNNKLRCRKICRILEFRRGATSNRENCFTCCSASKIARRSSTKGVRVHECTVSTTVYRRCGNTATTRLTPLGAFSIPSSRYLLDSAVSSLTRKSRHSHGHGSAVSAYLLCLKTVPCSLRPVRPWSYDSR